MIFEKLRHIIGNIAEVPEEDILMESELRGDLKLDSLSAVEIAMAVEDEFEIEVSDDVAEGFVTVEDIVNYISEVR